MTILILQKSNLGHGPQSLLSQRSMQHAKDYLHFCIGCWSPLDLPAPGPVLPKRKPGEIHSDWLKTTTQNVKQQKTAEMFKDLYQTSTQLVRQQKNRSYY